jgi:hypothetical protein
MNTTREREGARRAFTLEPQATGDDRRSRERLVRLSQLGGAALLLLSLVFCLYASFEPPRIRHDLRLVLDAAERFDRGEPVYRASDFPWDYNKPPFLHFVLAPLPLHDQDQVGQVWIYLSLITAAISAFFLAGEFVRGVALRALVASASLVVVALFLSFEAIIGQYNLITLPLILLALRGPPIAGSASLSLLLLLKPTNICLLPLVWHKGSRRVSTLLWCVVWFAILAIAYCSRFGWSRMIADHLEWLRFTEASVTRHLAREDNYSLLSVSRVLVNHGGVRIAILVAMFLGCEWIARKVPRLTDALALVFALIVFLSPLTWIQNFCLLLPAAISINGRLADGKSTRHALVNTLLWVGFAYLVLTSRIHFPGPLYTRVPWWIQVRVNPLLAPVLAATAMALLQPARRRPFVLAFVVLSGIAMFFLENWMPAYVKLSKRALHLVANPALPALIVIACVIGVLWYDRRSMERQVAS